MKLVQSGKLIMAPREAPKATPKIQRSIVKAVPVKSRSSPATVKKISVRKTIEKMPIKMNNKPVEIETRQRTNTVPKVSTPKPKENKPVPQPGSITKSVKKSSWKRRPKPAHSGVPVPEKMKQLLQKQLKDLDCSF